MRNVCSFVTVLKSTVEAITNALTEESHPAPYISSHSLLLIPN